MHVSKSSHRSTRRPLSDPIVSWSFKRSNIERDKKAPGPEVLQGKDTVTLGKSTELSGLSMWEFIEFLSENNVAVIDYSEEQLGKEFKSIERLRKALKS